MSGRKRADRASVQNPDRLLRWWGRRRTNIHRQQLQWVKGSMMFTNGHPTSNSIIAPFAAAANSITDMVEMTSDGAPILNQTGQIGMTKHHTVAGKEVLANLCM
jgi:hypothetical protein